MKDRDVIFIAGIITGAAASYYLQTPHGKRWLESLKSTSVSLSETALGTTRDSLESVKEKTDEIMATVNKKITENLALEMQRQDISRRLEEEEISDFQKGINRAKAKLGKYA